MKEEHSAGGIVFKKENGGVYLLLVKHARYHEWGFPKGHIGDTHPNESPEAAALREVSEETGIEAEIVSLAAEEDYIYILDGEKRHKTVTYYLMRYKRGNFAGKDHEMEDVEWVDLDQVENRLTHDEAKKMFRTIQGQIIELTKRM